MTYTYDININRNTGLKRLMVISIIIFVITNYNIMYNIYDRNESIQMEDYDFLINNLKG